MLTKICSPRGGVNAREPPMTEREAASNPTRARNDLHASKFGEIRYGIMCSTLIDVSSPTAFLWWTKQVGTSRSNKLDRIELFSFATRSFLGTYENPSIQLTVFNGSILRTNSISFPCLTE
jgi:hypothetical protein